MSWWPLVECLFGCTLGQEKLYFADLPQHVKSAALLAGAHCPKYQALGNTGWPEESYQLCRVPQIEGLISHDQTQKKKKKPTLTFTHTVTFLGKSRSLNRAFQTSWEFKVTSKPCVEPRAFLKQVQMLYRCGPVQCSTDMTELWPAPEDTVHVIILVWA
jgi:hypothetical protein